MSKKGQGKVYSRRQGSENEQDVTQKVRCKLTSDESESVDGPEKNSHLERHDNFREATWEVSCKDDRESRQPLRKEPTKTSRSAALTVEKSNAKPIATSLLTRLVECILVSSDPKTEGKWHGC